MGESRRPSPNEFRLVAQFLAFSVSPPWQRFVLRVMNTTGPVQGAKVAALLRNTLPAKEVALLAAV